MKDQYSDRIVRLIQLYLVGDITGEEQRELEEWCDAKARRIVVSLNRFVEKNCSRKNGSCTGKLMT